MPIIFTLLFLLLPAALLWLIEKQSWAQKLGAIILCYATGLILGNSGLIPASVNSIQTTISEVSIAFALPMLLFTLNIRMWSKMAGKAMYADTNSIESSHLAAMSVGVYTGGTPNLAAIKSGLNISNDLYLLFHSFDTLLGATYMLFMVSIAIPIFRFLLPKPEMLLKDSLSPQEQEIHNDDFSPLIKKENAAQIGKVIFISVCALALALAGAELCKYIFNLHNTAAATIILLTSFGILFSLKDSIRSLSIAYKMGMYLILVFCMVVASMADLKKLLEFDAMVAIFLFGTVTGSIILHALLCKLCNVDSDTFMVTSVSAICSPPFVPMMVSD